MFIYTLYTNLTTEYITIYFPLNIYAVVKCCRRLTKETSAIAHDCYSK